MAATLTVTGVTGPAVAVTAMVFTNVIDYRLDCVNNVIHINSNNKIKDISIEAATTITATKSGSIYTVTIS